MLKPVHRRTTGRLTDYLASADAFLLAGLLFVLAMGLLALAFDRPSSWSELLSQLALAGAVVGGAALGWGLHGHAFDRATWLALLAASVAGGIIATPVVYGIFLLGQLAASPIAGQEGPWGGIILLAVAVLAFLGPAMTLGIRDLVSRTGNPRVPVVRLAALVLVAGTITATLFAGGEIAELGIFMVPVSAASAAAVSLASWYVRRRRRGGETDHPGGGQDG
jgi:hypothetical protein